MQKKIKINNLLRQYFKIKNNLKFDINKILEKNNFILGNEVDLLEKKLARFSGSKYCITVSSGTDALLLSLMAIGVKKDDEVIVPAFSYIATVEVVVLLGARPVFVDVSLKTANMDLNQVSKKISKKTKAIIPVSLFGQPLDLKKLKKIIKNKKITIIEDGAQSFGASYNAKKSCNLSTIGCTSFFPSKPLGCYVDGGAIFTSNKKLNNLLRCLRIHGQIKKNIHERVGLQARLDTLQAAVLINKLKIFKKELSRRQSIAKKYDQFMIKNNIETIEVDSKAKSVYAQYTIKIKNRDKVKKILNSKGISTAIYYPYPLNEQKPYKKFCCQNCTPNAKVLSKQVLSIPFDPYLKNIEIERVCKELSKAINQT
jgi:UDP-2-acetamido-2-deoxy-ribo-hexuluronate aminotransferase